MGSTTFLAPASNPCVLTIFNNYKHKMQFNITGTSVSTYAFSMFYLSNSRFDRLGSEFVIESGVGQTKLFFGSTTTKPTPAKLIWSEYGYQPSNPVPITPIPPTPTPTPVTPPSTDSGSGSNNNDEEAAAISIQVPVSIVGFLLFLFSF